MREIRDLINLLPPHRGAAVKSWLNIERGDAPTDYQSTVPSVYEYVATATLNEAEYVDALLPSARAAYKAKAVDDYTYADPEAEYVYTIYAAITSLRDKRRATKSNVFRRDIHANTPWPADALADRVKAFKRRRAEYICAHVIGDDTSVKVQEGNGAPVNLLEMQRVRREINLPSNWFETVFKPRLIMFDTFVTTWAMHIEYVHNKQCDVYHAAWLTRGRGETEQMRGYIAKYYPEGREQYLVDGVCAVARHEESVGAAINVARRRYNALAAKEMRVVHETISKGRRVNVFEMFTVPRNTPMFSEVVHPDVPEHHSKTPDSPMGFVRTAQPPAPGDSVDTTRINRTTTTLRAMVNAIEPRDWSPKELADRRQHNLEREQRRGKREGQLIFKEGASRQERRKHATLIALRAEQLEAGQAERDFLQPQQEEDLQHA